MRENAHNHPIPEKLKQKLIDRFGNPFPPNIVVLQETNPKKLKKILPIEEVIEFFLNNDFDNELRHTNRKRLSFHLSVRKRTRYMRAHLHTLRKRRAILETSKTFSTSPENVAVELTPKRVAHIRVLLARATDMLMYDVPENSQTENHNVIVSLLHAAHPIIQPHLNNVKNILRVLVYNAQNLIHKIIADEIIENNGTLLTPETKTQFQALFDDLISSAHMLAIPDLTKPTDSTITELIGLLKHRDSQSIVKELEDFFNFNGHQGSLIGGNTSFAITLAKIFVKLGIDLDKMPEDIRVLILLKKTRFVTINKDNHDYLNALANTFEIPEVRDAWLKLIELYYNEPKKN